MDRLVYRSMSNKVLMKSSDDSRTMYIYLNDIFIAKFGIADLWDILCDILTSADYEHSNHSLNRRKKEALAAKAFTHITLMGEQDG